MNLWSLWTWISIVVLIFGSAMVFVWFLIDIVRIRQEIIGEEAAEPRDGS